ncbi:MAG: small permease of tripartite tricarboxylate transporter [Azospira oryzae]|uniref:Tripartite tricarboxylate transporter TctB family protein n=1 Tax=Pelomicrobium methylotrophicum TaxID=2602750 RepID=A0A5C7EG18_9PROT|nr:tripartite tricarboxylate transporter TctB family protein [Pelomicrobium methylotrophicum]PZP58156.1 MAG: small permease of tripartite tricarboxylate transporter [Azospira oryzae]PZP79649.1 MAG: small permease of tripartite tricarboxylate transporter [Azospira oryzae]TXF09945.1 tripartite tricarboxylate transporter TctB family protein [Pelomicrobium methylotrophicum]
MEHSEGTQEKAGKSCPVWIVDAVTAAILMLVGAIVMYDSNRIGAAWAPQVGPQAGYFPFYIGLLIFVCSAVTFYQSTFSKNRNRSVFVEWGQFKQVLKVLVPSIVYAVGVGTIGIYVSSALFIGGFMLVLGKYKLLPTLIVSVGVSLVMFWMFEIQFLIPLPKGPLEAWLGY